MSQRSVHSLLESIAKVEFRSALTKLFHAKYDNSERERTTIDSALSRTVVLRNAEDVLPGLLEGKVIRDWIKRQGNMKLYLTTGIKLFVDAQVSTRRASDVETSVSATIPVTDVVTAATGVALAFAGAADGTLSGLSSGHSTLKTTFTSVAETIFAIEYRQLKNFRKFLFGYEFEDVRLQPAVRTPYHKIRRILVTDSPPADGESDDEQGASSARDTFIEDDFTPDDGGFAEYWALPEDTVMENDFMPNDGAFAFEENGYEIWCWAAANEDEAVGK
ncbi:hypothetical protein SCP_0300300 [Sparassis crispa]|uniref:Uncharacterized protein n=1 Tax=Sparassis crispa TaxID=139825 RepID=A0A401GDW6_9APHY|nr:hypothetical protein SCP_0300300 [Sparassis crispa]GBE80315.1 hypothetical protein SCP_0300300 [Sparassis crispa]